MGKDSVLPRSILGAVGYSACGVVFWVLFAYLLSYRLTRTGPAEVGIALTGVLAGIGSIVHVGERGIRVALVAVGVAVAMLIVGGLVASYADWHGIATKARLDAMRRAIRDQRTPMFSTSDGAVVMPAPNAGPEVLESIRQEQLRKIDQMTYTEYCQSRRNYFFWELAFYAVTGIIIGAVIAYAPLDRR